MVESSERTIICQDCGATLTLRMLQQIGTRFRAVGLSIGDERRRWVPQDSYCCNVNVDVTDVD